jgi:hexosaminidase
MKALIAMITILVPLLARAEISLLPQPAEMKVGDGSFSLQPRPQISCSPEVTGEARYLAAATGLEMAGDHGGIELRLVPTRTQLGDEGYSLHVTARGILIEAAKPAGIFYGVQTLRQLMPADAKAIPFMEITDQPRFAWRGLMLDVSRHYFDKQEVEAILEQMACLKMNVFHWHLTDDNGGRIEIKKYPKLTTVGAWHAITDLEKNSIHIKDEQYGGFYTQDDIRELVVFAAARHITIVPEVDIPGHCSAAMTAYPELAPENGWTPIIATGQKTAGEKCGAMCVGKPDTVQFCKDVIDELLPLFPSHFIHIGGDEVFYEQWQPCPISQKAMHDFSCHDMADLQIHFTNEMVAYVESKGRHAIIWNNLYRQTVDKRAINQFWRDMHPARDFANAGYTVLVSDSSKYYFDHHPALEKAYANDPMVMPKPGLSAEAMGRVPGIEACAWTEKVPDTRTLYQQIYPLLFADAETGWTANSSKNWKSFTERVAVQQVRFDFLAKPRS